MVEMAFVAVGKQLEAAWARRPYLTAAVLSDRKKSLATRKDLVAYKGFAKGTVDVAFGIAEKFAPRIADAVADKSPRANAIAAIRDVYRGPARSTGSL